MARKNNNVRRSNDRGRMSRMAERDVPRVKVKSQPRVSMEEMILPDGTCTLMNKKRPKARFATKAKADAALRQAQQQRARTGSTHVEKRVYECPEGGCGGWHLSSRETFDDSIRIQRREQFEQQTKEQGPGRD